MLINNYLVSDREIVVNWGKRTIKYFIDVA